MLTSSTTQPLLTPEYIIYDIPKKISKEKYNSYYNSIYLNKLNSISNLIELPSKSKEEIKTYFSFLTTFKNEFYINCGNVLISLNPEPTKNKKIKNTELPYFTLNKWCEKTVNTPITQWPCHIYSFTHQVFNAMMKQNKDQVITLTGNIGSGKSFNLNKIIQYLFFISSKNEINKEVYDITIKSIKMMTLLGSVYRDDNMESTSSGFVYHFGFNENNEICSFDLDSEILDCTMPFSENGRSFTLLHGFFLTQGENMGFGRQIFNFFKKYFKKISVDEDDTRLKYYSRKDIENWEIFGALCKEFLTEKEYQNILNIFYVILLCNEVTILKNKKIKNGKKIESYYINKNNVTKKIASLLNIDEKKFTDSFNNCSSLQQHKTLLVSLMKYSYFCVHDFILNKIKMKLNTVFTSKIIKNSIHIIDFPGQIKDETLGGLTLNFSNECLNLYSISNYTSMLSVLESNGIKLKRFEAPLSFEILKALVGENGLLTFLNNDQNLQINNKKIKSIITKNDNMPNIIEYVNNNNIIKISYSFQSVFYSFSDLQMEALTLYPPTNILRLLKASKNEIYNINNSSSTYNNIVISDYVLNKMRYLLCGLENIEPFIVFCLGVDDVYANSNNYLQRSIIYNVLDWEWYGFEEWIKVDDFVKEFNANFEKIKMFFINKDKVGTYANDSNDNIGNSPSEICNNIIIVLSLENECKVGSEYVFMKKGSYKNIKQIFNALLETMNNMENVSTNNNLNKGNGCCYYYNNVSKRKTSNPSKKALLKLIKDKQNKRKSRQMQIKEVDKDKNSNKDSKSELLSNRSQSHFNLISISKIGNSVREKGDSEEYNKYSIDNILNGHRLTERNKNNVILSNENEYNNIKKFFDVNQQFHSKPFDINTHLPFLIKIQSKYRGYIIRKKITKMFRYIKYNIVLLQKNIRGFLLRMKFYKFLECLKRIILLQIFFKGRYEKKTISAITIQRFFRKTYYGEGYTLSNNNYNTSYKKKKINNISAQDLLNETDKSKIINYILFNSYFINESKYQSKNPHDSNLYYYLKDLENKNSKKNKKGDKLEDRLIQYGKNLRIRNLQRLSDKMSNELNDYTFQPKVNSDYSFKKYNGSSFFERNEKFLQEKNDKINMIKQHEFYTSKQQCTFHPMINNKDGKKRSIDDLYEWQERVNKEKEDMRKIYEEYKNQQIDYYTQYNSKTKTKKQVNLTSQLKQIKKDYKNQNKNSFNEDDIYFGKNPDNYYTSDNNESEYCYQPENDTASDIWPYNMKKQFLI